MPGGKTRLAKQAIKYGPVVYAMAQKYGPQVVDQILKQREPATRFVQDQAARTRTNPRKHALAHADTVVEGSLQQVFHRGQPYWVVFSRNEPVGVHPHTDAPFDTLLLNADPGKRHTPDELRRTVHLPRRGRR
ncbi:hypothetical protein SGUI_1400 [Serinicoccus hydrothermalis]|uniref:Uncharacterized protein n=1 Tax=Serinicoccus hydrothermalis TaxID=1758689 RepID=A0A1B1NBJ4_9MICO|nr:hypothetical protein [Serinicoccus hydrothermalis]ANS78796.1 hypothetical protein SGUI_1400 [Serinicoccus hydrothermalis]